MRPKGRGRRRGRRRPSPLGKDVKSVDYKNVELLQFFMAGATIRSRRATRTLPRHQRLVTRAIKRARHLALLPYTSAQVRDMRS